MRRTVRLAATALVALGAGAGLAVAQDALRTATPPEIVADLEGPLFQLQAMTPGAAPIERCVTVYPRGGRADDVFLSGDVEGQLAGTLRQEVAAGRAADGVRAGRDCTGFVPDRTLWSGRLSDFPAEAAPLQDGSSLAPGQPRVYRFRVWLDAAGTVPLDWLAEQDLQWRAELDELPETTAPVTTVVTQTQTQTQSETQVQTVTVPGRPDVVTTPAPAPRTCARQPAQRPARVFVVDGRRVSFLVGPARRLQPGEPLELRVRDTAGVVHRATYSVDGHRLAALGARPWKAALPVGMLREQSTVLVRLETVSGRLRHGRVELTTSDCPPIVRVTAPGTHPSVLTLDVDPGVAVGRVGVALPAGVLVAGRGLGAVARPAQRVRVTGTGRRVALGAIRAGTAVRVRIPVRAATRAALARARCARSEVVLRLEPLEGPSRYVRVPLMGRGGGCVR